MPSSDTRRQPSAAAIERARKWLTRDAEIRAGALPTHLELLRGYPPLRQDWAADASIWARSILAHDEVDDANLRASLEVLSATFKAGVVRRVLAAVRAVEERYPPYWEVLMEASERLQVYMAALGGTSVTWIEERWAMMGPRRETAATLTMLGMIWHKSGSRPLPLEFNLKALNDLTHIVEVENEFRAAIKLVLNEGDEIAATAVSIDPDDLPDPTDDDAIADVIEDRAEFRMGRRRPAGQVVITLQDTKSLTNHQRDVARAFEPISGERLPIVSADPVAARIALALRFPHAIDAIDAILRDLSVSTEARLRPILLVGSPGGGKTALARALGSALGLYTTVYSCGGAMDASFGGTSSQWTTARPSVPLDAVRASATANPMIVLDEIEKAGTSSHNGRLVNTLLSFLEPAHASAIRDLALEVDVDLSAVCYVATANSLVGIPDPLRDRFRIVEVPEPGWEHVGDLARGILHDIAAERGIDRRWLEDLALDELEVLRSAWDGGSIRKLRRALEVLVDGRDSLIGRA